MHVGESETIAAIDGLALLNYSTGFDWMENSDGKNVESEKLIEIVQTYNMNCQKPNALDFLIKQTTI